MPCLLHAVSVPLHKNTSIANFYCTFTRLDGDNRTANLVNKETLEQDPFETAFVNMQFDFNEILQTDVFFNMNSNRDYNIVLIVHYGWII